MKRILVPTDLTDIAEKGLMLGVEIAKRTRAEIFLINFHPHPQEQSFATSGEARRRELTQEQRYNIELLQMARSQLNLLRTHYSQEGVIIHVEIVDQNFTDGVNEVLEKYAIDLIVMGTSGEENFEERFTGNHVERITNVASCPVISVRDNFNLSQFSDIVLAMDVVRDVDLYDGLQTLKKISEIFEATVHIVHVVDPTIRQDHRELETYFRKGIGERFRFHSYDVTLLSSEDEAEAVIRYADKINAGIIAVLKNSVEGMFRIFSDHFSDRLVKEVGRPVFTYNLQQA